MPTHLLEVTVVIWDESDPWAACVCHTKCTLCRGRLRLPFAMWIGSSREEDPDGWIEDATTFICSECCTDMCRGLSIDMKQIVTAKEVGRLGFHRAARRAAVSGGFLYTTGTDNKQ
jgi:hypothetical protein